ncbi:DUF3800 domain-containing protein [Flavobacterium sp. DGU38]|uniref:DUF3800 domain-containing protein n=1 Tax=Flavobacterium calami TaxID=3139144 RepID=A0ABU9IIA4_9FLAO
MSKRTIYFDESGNTGQDMLNQDQKVFVLASVSFNNEELEELEKIFGVQGEMHFKKLRKSIEGRKKILQFLNHEYITESRVMFSSVHKEFNVCGQITDQLIETAMHHRGHDIYVKANNIFYMNYLFYFGNFFWDGELYMDLIKYFVEMIRTKTQESIESFYETVAKLLDSVEEKSVLEPVLESRKYIDEILDSTDKYTIDVTFSTFLVLCDRWYKFHNSPIDVKLDVSKQISHYSDYLDHTRQLAESGADKTQIGYDERVTIFPPQIGDLQMVDSKDEFGVQCADLIASAITFMYNNEEGNNAPFAKEIQKTKLLDLSNAFVIWPSDSESLNAMRSLDQGGINPNDFLAEYFS